MTDVNSAEKQQDHFISSASSHSQNEKTGIVHEETAHEAASRGHLATDVYGNAIVHFDPEAEKRLLRKIDWYVVPTVAILYLFCFIDRANIGALLLERSGGDI